jgi:integrase
MPRLINQPPKYSLHKPSGQAKVRFNGRTVYLGKHGTQASLEAYAQFIAKLRKPEEPSTLLEPTPGVVLLIGEVVLRYIAYAEKYYVRDGAPTGEHVTIRNALDPLVTRYADLPVTEFTPAMLEQLQEDMIGLDRSRSYVNKSCDIIRRCFKWCVRKGFVTSGVLGALQSVDGLKKGRSAARETAPIGPVDDQHVQAVLPKVSVLVGDVVQVMRFTGMRPGEVLSMSAAEIDRTDPTCWVFRPGHHKSEHRGLRRTVFLGPNAIEIVRRYLVKTADGNKLFPITRDSLRRAITRGCRRVSPHPTISSIRPKKRTDEQKAELAAWHKAHRWHPNQLRHSVATEVRARFGLEAAQVLLGHTRADVTQTYAERDMSKARDVARKIG